MKVSTHIRRIFCAALTGAAFAVAVPIAGAADDGTILSRAALQPKAAFGAGQVMDDGTLLSRASERAAQLLQIHPGRVTDGMLLTEASLLHQLAQINPGRGTGESIVSELATAGSPASTNATPGGFDWSEPWAVQKTVRPRTHASEGRRQNTAEFPSSLVARSGVRISGCGNEIGEPRVGRVLPGQRVPEPGPA